MAAEPVAAIVLITGTAAVTAIGSLDPRLLHAIAPSFPLSTGRRPNAATLRRSDEIPMMHAAGHGVAR
ncbi:hypothetical protein [Streptomyces sp. NPDC003036]|uniref:hypothetical protein n=1 Tax=Streptomyces sp. NPDC003036 TaxID=3154442 RepID=UPI0033B8A44E